VRVLTTVIVDTGVLTTVVVTELVVITDDAEVLDVELDIDENADVVGIELEPELKPVRVVALVEFGVVCSGDADFGDICRGFSEPRTVV
jgi:uncharacterized protein YuzE